MSLTHVFLLIVFFSVKQINASQQYKSPSTRIVGGYEVEPHSIPYQAFLNVTSNAGSWICGGSLISQNYVLTAGRCLFGAKSVTVVLGAHDLNEKNIYQVTLESTNFTINPKFTTNVLKFVYVEDIAVIALPKPVKLHDFLQPIRLPNPYDWTNRFINATGKISGWGLTDGHNKTSYSRVLLAQETRIIGDSECMNFYYDLHNYDICVQVNETDSPCIGDYGSPLTVGDIQVGIASQGYDDCEPDSPFIYTRLSDFLTWIKANTDYVDDYTTQTTTEGTTEVTKSTTTKSTTKPTIRTTTDTTSTTTGKATSSNCLNILLFSNIVIILTNVLMKL